MVSGFIIKALDVKKALFISHIIAITGMLLMIIVDPSDEQQGLISLFILGGKFGVSSAFNIVYIGTYDLFPISIVGTCFGICNIFSRVACIVAPLVAELHPEEIGEWTFCVIVILAFWFCFLIVLPKDMEAGLD